MAAGGVILLLLGVGIGFAIGRATAPRPVTPGPSVQTETTLPVETEDTSLAEETTATGFEDETDESLETTLADTTRPPTPKQLAPSNGDILTTARVTLRWSKVEDDSELPVTYAFEIQDRLSNGTYGRTQIIKDLKTNSYSARVLSVRRRWRVWSVDDAGNLSKKSAWRSFIHKYVPPKKSTNSSSSETSDT